MKLLSRACLATALLLGALPAAQAESFRVPQLPYALSALEPAISAETMRVHHGLHHQAYVDNLNKALASEPALQGRTLDQLLAAADQLPSAIRNNAGGHYNHALFWQLLAPAGEGGEPSAALSAAISRDFGSQERFQTSFAQAAGSVFGSGWTWLVLNPEGRLAIVTTPNQDNPLMPDVGTQGVPLLALDVWEHAYYLGYQNKRADYIQAWWGVVNWGEVSRRYAALKR